MLRYSLGMERVLRASVVACLFCLLTWAPARAATAPSITTEGVSAITSTDATLEAEIDPGNTSGAYYQFQLSKFPSEFADEIFCPPDIKPFVACAGPDSASALPIGHVPGAGGAVALDLAGAGVTLKPGATYYFRVVAALTVPTEDTIEWEEPVVGGEVGTFTTESTPPVNPSAGDAGSGGSSAGPAPQPGTEPLNRIHRHHPHKHHHRRFQGMGISRAWIVFKPGWR